MWAWCARGASQLPGERSLGPAVWGSRSHSLLGHIRDAVSHNTVSMTWSPCVAPAGEPGRRGSSDPAEEVRGAGGGRGRREAAAGGGAGRSPPARDEDDPERARPLPMAVRALVMRAMVMLPVVMHPMARRAMVMLPVVMLPMAMRAMVMLPMVMRPIIGWRCVQW